jgi:NADPH:quinone reductase-like Zn-dependent oxidoreductase
MLAYRLLEAQTQPEFQEVPEPHAGPGQVVVRVAGSGLCHTDFKILVDRYPLSAAKKGYDDFKNGRLVGRGVLVPAALKSAGDAASATA